MTRSLSDACFDFLVAVAEGKPEGEATAELLEATVW